MKVNHHGNKRVVFVVLIVLTIISLQLGWWIALSLDQSLSYEQLQERFLQPYPAFLGSARAVTGINLLLALVCWLWSMRTLIRASKDAIGWTALVWSSVLVIWLGFSLS